MNYIDQTLKQLKERQEQKKPDKNKVPDCNDPKYVETYSDGTKLIKYNTFLRDVAAYVAKNEKN